MAKADLFHRLQETGVTVAFVASALLGIIVAVSAGLESAGGHSVAWIAWPISAGFVVILVLSIFTRFEYFLLLVLAIRTTVDWTRGPGGDIRGAETSSGLPAALLALTFVASALLWLWMKHKTDGLRPFSILSLAMGLLLIAGAISTLGSVRPADSLSEFSRITVSAMMLFVVEQLISNREQLRRILAAIFAAAIVPVIVAMYQIIGGTGLLVTGRVTRVGRVSGTLLHPNNMAFLLTLFLITGFAVYRYMQPRARVGIAALCAVSLVALTLTYSRGSWAGLVLGLALVGFLQSRRILAGLLVAFPTVLLVLPNITARITEVFRPDALSGPDNSLVWRLDYWRELVSLGARSPIFGVGLKGTQTLTASGKVPHNDLIKAFVEMGLIGVMAYLFFIVAIVIVARKALALAPQGLERSIAVAFAGNAVAYVVASLGGNLISQVVLLWYFLALAGAAVAAGRFGEQALRSPDYSAARRPDPAFARRA